METSYDAISKEIGFIGYMPFPPMQEMDVLLSNLSLNPTIADFKRALSLYRFTPEAETEEQRRIIYMLQLGLSISKKELFPEKEKQPVLAAAVSYLMNLLPSVTL